MSLRLMKTKDRADLSGRKLLDVKFKPAEIAELKQFETEADVPDGYVAGWASTKDLDFYRDVVMPGAFQQSISAKGLSGPKGVKLLIHHDRSRPAGVITKLEYRGDNLWIEAQLNLDITYVKDVYVAAKMNGGLSFSVGFYLEDYEFKTMPGSDVEYLQINRAELEEVSVVVFPGNENAIMSFIKSDGTGNEPPDGGFPAMSDFEKWLVHAGLAKSRNDANRIARAAKTSPHLFQPKEDESPVKPPKPVVAKATLDRISEQLQKLRETFE